MSKSVVTNVTLISANEITESDEAEILEKYDADSLEEVAESMEEDVESVLAHRVFATADRIPLIDVSTDVYEEWDEDTNEVRA